MATTNKSTSRPKAKTSKKSTTNRSTKTRSSAARTTTAKTTKRVVKKKTDDTVEIRQVSTKKTTTTAKPSWRVATMDRIFSMHLMLLGVLLVLAVAAVTQMSGATQELTINHLTKNVAQSSSSTVFAQASQAVLDIELRWVLAGLMVLAAVLPALYLTRMQEVYRQYVDRTRMVPFRWLGWGVVGALMTELVAVLYGVTDIVTLKLIGGMVLVSALLGLVAERQNNQVEKPVKSAFWLSVLTGALPLALIAATGIATYVHGMERSPWYVYAAFAALVFGFVMTALNLLRSISNRTQNNVTTERNYLVVGALTHVVFAIVLIVGLRAA